MVDTSRYTRVDPDDFPEISDMAQRALDAALATMPKGVGTALLFAFDYGAGKRLGWVSTADRESILVMLLEWLGTQDPALLAKARARYEREERARRG